MSLLPPEFYDETGENLGEGPCNFCTWRKMSKRGYRIDPDAKNINGGVTVVNENGEFVAWFMALPDHCCCSSD